LIIVMGVIFILGFFLDFIEIAVVVVPIVAPILLADPAANITAVWLGVMIGLNIQTSFLTPPFGFALFYLRGVAPLAVKTIAIYKGVIAFICLQLLALAIVGYYPQMVNYLPNRMSLLSESSPPPRNPKLQICLEEYVAKKISHSEKDITEAIKEAKTIELEFLPKKIKSSLSSTFRSADLALNLIYDIEVKAKAVLDNSKEYRPLLNTVRTLESKVRWNKKVIKTLKGSLNYLKSDADTVKRQNVEEEIAQLENVILSLKSQIPANWKETYKDFNKLTKAETKARLKYRKSADQSFTPVLDFISILTANNAYFNVKSDIETLRKKIISEDIKDAELFAKKLKTKLSKISGATKVAAAIRKIQKQLRPGKTDVEKSLVAHEKALKLYNDQATWRLEADKKIKSKLLLYLSSISETLGARQQPKLTRSQALYLAKCNSGHRDLSLNF
jgi:bacterioferritin (cytochrome b1)